MDNAFQFVRHGRILIGIVVKGYDENRKTDTELLYQLRSKWEPRILIHKCQQISVLRYR